MGNMTVHRKISQQIHLPTAYIFHFLCITKLQLLSIYRKMLRQHLQIVAQQSDLISDNTNQFEIT